MRFVWPLLLLSTPALTFFLLTTYGKEITSEQATILETFFDEFEQIYPKASDLGLNMDKIHMLMNERYGWCGKQKISTNKSQPMIPNPAAPLSGDKQNVKAVSQVVSMPASPPPRDPTNNIVFAKKISLSKEEEIFCKNPYSESLRIQSTDQAQITLRRYWKYLLLIPTNPSQIDIDTPTKLSFYLRLPFGDAWIQSESTAHISLLRSNSDLELTIHSGKITLSLFRSNKNLRESFPIKIQTKNTSSARWGEREIKDGQSSLLTNAGFLLGK